MTLEYDQNIKNFLISCLLLMEYFREILSINFCVLFIYVNTIKTHLHSGDRKIPLSARKMKKVEACL